MTEWVVDLFAVTRQLQKYGGLVAILRADVGSEVLMEYLSVEKLVLLAASAYGLATVAELQMRIKQAILASKRIAQTLRQDSCIRLISICEVWRAGEVDNGYSIGPLGTIHKDLQDRWQSLSSIHPITQHRKWINDAGYVSSLTELDIYALKDKTQAIEVETVCEDSHNDLLDELQTHHTILSSRFRCHSTQCPHARKITTGNTCPTRAIRPCSVCLANKSCVLLTGSSQLVERCRRIIKELSRWRYLNLSNEEIVGQMWRDCFCDIDLASIYRPPRIVWVDSSQCVRVVSSLRSVQRVGQCILKLFGTTLGRVYLDAFDHLPSWLNHEASWLTRSCVVCNQVFVHREHSSSGEALFRNARTGRVQPVCRACSSSLI